MSSTILDRIKWKSKPHPPKSRMKSREGQNEPFSHLWCGGRRGGVYIISIYFVEDCRFCEQYYLDKLLKGWRKSWQLNILLFKAVLFLANGCTWLNYLRGKGELQAVSMNKIPCCRSETHLYTWLEETTQWNIAHSGKTQPLYAPTCSIPMLSNVYMGPSWSCIWGWRVLFIWCECRGSLLFSLCSS